MSQTCPSISHVDLGLEADGFLDPMEDKALPEALCAGARGGLAISICEADAGRDCGAQVRKSLPEARSCFCIDQEEDHVKLARTSRNTFCRLPYSLRGLPDF